jgi:hypothetical protein
MTQTPDNNEYAAIEAPLTFLALRGSLVSHRTTAERLGLTSLLHEIDQLLEETEAVTRILLLRTPMPDDEYLDPIFDDEFLALCHLMGVNVLAWVNQPQILARLRDPDAILTRWVTGTAWDVDNGGVSPDSTGSYSEQVGNVKEAIHVLFQFLRDSGLV